jgi:hypothetical protein
VPPQAASSTPVAVAASSPSGRARLRFTVRAVACAARRLGSR